jgi:hypothetical protein
VVLGSKDTTSTVSRRVGRFTLLFRSLEGVLPLYALRELASGHRKGRRGVANSLLVQQAKGLECCCLFVCLFVCLFAWQTFDRVLEHVASPCHQEDSAFMYCTCSKTNQ